MKFIIVKLIMCIDTYIRIYIHTDTEWNVTIENMLETRRIKFEDIFNFLCKIFTHYKF